MVSDTVFRNTVNERRIVTPGIYRLCYFKSFPDLCFLSNILLVLPVYIRMGLSMSLSHSNIIWRRKIKIRICHKMKWPHFWTMVWKIKLIFMTLISGTGIDNVIFKFILLLKAINLFLYLYLKIRLICIFYSNFEIKLGFGTQILEIFLVNGLIVSAKLI